MQNINISILKKETDKLFETVKHALICTIREFLDKKCDGKFTFPPGSKTELLFDSPMYYNEVFGKVELLSLTSAQDGSRKVTLEYKTPACDDDTRIYIREEQEEMTESVQLELLSLDEIYNVLKTLA